MQPNQKQVKEVNAKDRKAFRKWLGKNYLQKESIWLVIHKKNSTGKSVSYAEAVEEALCFGWIDSRPNMIDAEKYKILFSPRKAKSVWSKINKQKIELLLQQGLMAAPGLAKIEAAKINGSWTTLDAIEEFIMPKDLQKAFAKNKKALQYFDAFPASVKKGIYQWISSAKQETTKQKRITETVQFAEKNIRANQYLKK